MANFTVQFEESQNLAPTYEDYGVGVRTKCSTDAAQLRVRFNDIVTGDFVVGYNYSSPMASPATTLIITQYIDEMFWIDNVTGATTVPTFFDPSELSDNGTTISTFPHYVSINTLGDLAIVPHSGELHCPPKGSYAIRTRTISYMIRDANNLDGPLRKATFINNED